MTRWHRIARRRARRTGTPPWLALGLALLAAAQAWAQADYEREKRWAAEIVPGLLVGKAVELEVSSGRAFLGIYAGARPQAPGVILVHGLGVHPDWGVINVLRSDLADHGYATLSIQMPVLASTARPEDYEPLYPEAAERLAAAAQFLRDRGHSRLAIVSHSLGARMAHHYLARASAADVAAWVVIGFPGSFDAVRLQTPVLDIYGERDPPHVRDNAPARAEALRRVTGSAQIEVAEAGHLFTGHERTLVRHVQLFLDRKLK